MFLQHSGLSVIDVGIIGGTCSLIVAILFWLPVHMRWLLPRDFATFRLDLVRAEPAPSPSHSNSPHESQVS